MGKRFVAGCVVGSFVLLVWAPFAVMDLGSNLDIVRKGGPYRAGQIIFYAGTPSLMCTAVLASFVVLLLNRRRRDGYVPGVLIVAYPFIMMLAILPYLLLFTGGI